MSTEGTPVLHHSIQHSTYQAGVLQFLQQGYVVMAQHDACCVVALDQGHLLRTAIPGVEQALVGVKHLRQLTLKGAVVQVPVYVGAQ